LVATDLEAFEEATKLTVAWDAGGNTAVVGEEADRLTTLLVLVAGDWAFATVVGGPAFGGTYEGLEKKPEPKEESKEEQPAMKKNDKMTAKPEISDLMFLPSD
jgi:phosphoribosyl-ATP pyrophosphohydrolase